MRSAEWGMGNGEWGVRNGECGMGSPQHFGDLELLTE